ncbi:ubiquitin-like-conjugating enzyme ATG10 [Nematostella vectensis]|uniref:ubiquitin-like-conjugating enzyme ATG10 n=1 Tax=Nematostella vectensis TaxID=45351 RepID=UPI0020774896|nr:ubiquitin-like-conjugating enzyme ATG10 [Nematostella vectensis]
MWKDGRISHDVFNTHLEDFLRVSKILGDDWEVRIVANAPKIVSGVPVKYLVKRSIVAIESHKAEDGERSLQYLEGLEASESYVSDDECELISIASSAKDSYWIFVYHVLYSPSYSVPVLYFTANKQDGTPLSLEEVWSNIPHVYHQRLQYEKWTFLTQQEHPILGAPCFQLHPCHTADLMKNTSPTGSCTAQGSKQIRTNYLVSWLSQVGPVVGLNLPLQYCSSQEGNCTTRA